MSKPRLVFMGTPDFAVPALAALYEEGFEIVAVYSQPPRPAGRGYEVKKSPVQLYAESKNIPVFHPKNFKDQADKDIFASHEVDVAIVAAYGLILPEAILNAPRFGCINIHGSLLPRWRGAAPIQRSIEMGDKETGICIMQMEKGLDTGAVMKQDSVEILSSTTASGLHDALSEMGATLIVPSVYEIIQGEAVFVLQDDALATYAHKLEKQEGCLDLSLDADVLDRKIRAFSPWPGTYIVLPSGKRCKIISSTYCPDITGKAGEIIDKNLTIACGQYGALRLDEVQPESKSKMTGSAFMNGYGLKVGDILVSS